MNSWWIYIIWVVELTRVMQIPSVSLWSKSVSSPSQSCFSALFSEANHKHIQQEQFLHTPVPCRQSDLGIQYYLWSEGYIRETVIILLKGTGTKCGDTWELILGWGILPHSSPPGWAYLQPTSFIGRIFPSLYIE